MSLQQYGPAAIVTGAQFKVAAPTASARTGHPQQQSPLGLLSSFCWRWTSPLRLPRRISTISRWFILCLLLLLLLLLAAVVVPTNSWTSPASTSGATPFLRRSTDHHRHHRIHQQKQQTVASFVPRPGITSTTKMASRISGAAIPEIIYGTAWKKDKTALYVEQAIRAGFRAVDTACQPKHYFEKGVGDALASLYAAGVVARGDIFLQTKFTPLRGQDPHQIPYQPNATLVEQVHQSFAQSLLNLRTDYIDSLVLHSPMEKIQDTLTVWKTFEEIHRQGKVSFLGLSNTYDLSVLQRVYQDAEIKPTFLQNRFYQETGYDKEIRRFCQEKAIRYQSFWTLTANPHIVRSSAVRSLSTKYGKTPEQIFFRFVQLQGIIPLSGTTSEEHMQQDLEASQIAVDASEAAAITRLLG